MLDGATPVPLPPITPLHAAGQLKLMDTYPVRLKPEHELGLFRQIAAASAEAVWMVEVLQLLVTLDDVTQALLRNEDSEIPVSAMWSLNAEFQAYKGVLMIPAVCIAGFEPSLLGTIHGPKESENKSTESAN